MMEVNTEDSRVGSVLNGRYRIIERIAAGGMAVVYRGERVELGRPVAVKFLQEIMLQHPKFISRFEAEARAMSKLSHPYCVSVIDYGVDGAPYIVMDFVEGRTLKEVLATEEMTPARAVTVVRQILAGIAHAHGQGIVHRDIKPENIMLQQSVGVGESVRIFDFGLAKLADAAVGSLSISSMVAGTPNYMSPEQSRGKKVDKRTDLYSVCVVLFELLTGRKPFVHEDFIEVVRMHREEAPPRLNDIAGKGAFSTELEAVVHKAMAKSPDDRFQSAEAFTAALEETPEGARAKDTESAPPADPQGKTLPIGAQSAGGAPPSPGGDRRGFRTRYPRMFRLFVALFSAAVGTALLWAALREKKAPPATIVLQGPAVDNGADGASARTGPKASAADVDGAARSNGAALQTSEGEKGAVGGAENGAAELGADTDAEGESDSDGPSVRTVQDARRLIKAGEREAAIAGLEKLRWEETKNAQVILLLGELYFEKVWWSDALDYYATAIRLNPAYKRKLTIQRDVIETLGSDKTARKASYVLQKVIGKPALPRLRRAAKKDPNPAVRRRAAALIKKMQK